MTEKKEDNLIQMFKASIETNPVNPQKAKLKITVSGKNPFNIDLEGEGDSCKSIIDLAQQFVSAVSDRPSAK